MSLSEYHRKRDFSKTQEPEGSHKRNRTQPIYVIQEHHATHLHWDLRLEIDGVLRSWAVPKKPPERVGVKRLAVEVEDHPIEYASFEGTIPEGEYGAGVVKIWDRGMCHLVKLTDKKIIVDINGDRLNGRYCLLRFREDKNWLFFKMKSK